MAQALLPEPVVDVRELYYAYGGRVALNGVTFRIYARSIHGFVGPNGAGKTTCLKVLATLLRTQPGRVTLFGKDVVRDRDVVRTRLGFMPDTPSMYRQMTVFEYLDFFGAAYGQRQAERDRVISDVLELTDMSGRRDEVIKSLSRGMQQRVSLARCLVHDPELLLLDEPAAGLDPRARIELMEILKELKRMGKTIFISSHILAELATLCDSVTIIDQGAVRYSGDIDDLAAQEGATDTYVLTLAVEDIDTEQALREAPGVEAVIKLEDRPVYHVTFDYERTTTNDLLRAALQGQGRVLSFQRSVRHLQEAFMDLTSPGVPG
jgi:ABC-2 type transport system ATP-binding protein